MLYDLISRFFLITTLFSSPVFANIEPSVRIIQTYENTPSAPIPVRIQSNSIGINVSADNVYILDKDSKFMLYGKKVLEPKPAASLTKLMSALVLLDLIEDWEKQITVTQQDRREGNIVYLFSGERVSAKTLFNLMLISSSNEATAALVRSTGLTDFEFVDRMNQKARDMNLFSTQFFDPTGLDTRNTSSAFDITLLAQDVFSRPEVIESSQKEQFDFVVENTGQKRAAYSTNRLFSSFLNDPDLGYFILAAKTGYLDEVGYNMTIQVVKDNHPVIITVIGSSDDESRSRDVKGLADWIYSNFRWVP